MGRAVTRAFDAKGLQFAVQDGPASGQTVPHQHIHVLPRRPNDFARNDDEYEAIEGSERQLTRLEPVVVGVHGALRLHVFERLKRGSSKQWRGVQGAASSLD